MKPISQKTTRGLLIAVSLLLICVLVVQCLFWAGAFAPKTQRAQTSADVEAVGNLSREGYRLEQVVILSRHNIRSPLSGSGSVLFILLVFLIYLPLSVLIPSTSGLATLSIPILAPLGQFAGVNSSIIITAFQSASGIVNLWTPTAGVLMGALALGWVPYDKWLKFSLKPVLCFLLLTAALLALAAL